MENKKSMIIVISILFIYFIFMVIVFGLDSLKKRYYYVTILMAPNTYLTYEKGVWKDVTKEREQLLGNAYYVYEDHQLLYHEVLQYANGKWYAFDENRKSLSLPTNFFAYNGNMTIDIKNDYQINDMSQTEISEAKGFLKELGISFEPIFTKTLKVEYDLNHDGEVETIYIISNTLGMDEQSTYFSIAYMKAEENIQILVEDISENMYAVPSLNIKEIIDVNKDQKYELILEKIYFNNIGTCHQVFEYRKDMYQSVKDCKIIKRGDEEE